MPFSGEGGSGTAVVVDVDSVVVVGDVVVVDTAVSTGANVVSSDVVGVASSPPQEAANKTMAATVRSVFGVFTRRECIRGPGTSGIGFCW